MSGLINCWICCGDLQGSRRLRPLYHQKPHSSMETRDNHLTTVPSPGKFLLILYSSIPPKLCAVRGGGKILCNFRYRKEGMSGISDDLCTYPQPETVHWLILRGSPTGNHSHSDFKMAMAILWPVTEVYIRALKISKVLPCRHLLRESCILETSSIIQSHGRSCLWTLLPLRRVEIFTLKCPYHRHPPPAIHLC